MKHPLLQRSSTLTAKRLGLLPAALGSLGLLMIGLSQASDLSVQTAADAQYEYNSNIFAADGNYTILGALPSQRGDSYYAYGGLFDVADVFSEQKLFLNMTGTQYRYDVLTELNHDDYRVDGGLNWRIGDALDGTLEGTRTHTLVPFIDLFQLQPALETEQRETAMIGLMITPDWRLEGTGYYRFIEEPLIVAPDLELTERSGLVTVEYLGGGKLTSGISGGYLTGDYTGTNGTDQFYSYKQTTFGVVANYGKLTDKSSFTGQLGYTERTAPAIFDKVSGITGLFDYRNQITGKTSIDLDLSRQISEYIANSGSMISDAAIIKANWQATYKLDVTAGYTWTFNDMPGQGNAPVGSARHDFVQYATIAIAYAPVTWLELRPYANVETRRSNYIGANFNDTIYGVYLTLKWQNEPPANVPGLH